MQMPKSIKGPERLQETGAFATRRAIDPRFLKTAAERA